MSDHRIQFRDDRGGWWITVHGSPAVLVEGRAEMLSLIDACRAALSAAAQCRACGRPIPRAARDGPRRYGPVGVGLAAPARARERGGGGPHATSGTV